MLLKSVERHLNGIRIMTKQYKKAAAQGISELTQTNSELRLCARELEKEMWLQKHKPLPRALSVSCLLYTSDAADEL